MLVFGSLSHTLSIYIAVLFIPLGIVLCKYSLKALLISILGTAWLIYYVSGLMAPLNKELYSVGLLPYICFKYLFPALLFVTAAVGIMRYGLEIRK